MRRVWNEARSDAKRLELLKAPYQYTKTAGITSSQLHVPPTTPLLIATMNAHYPIVEFLLLHGIGGDHKLLEERYESKTALHHASFNGQTEIVRLLGNAGASLSAKGPAAVGFAFQLHCFRSPFLGV